MQMIKKKKKERNSNNPICDMFGNIHISII